jgi:hypothetical protein
MTSEQPQVSPSDLASGTLVKQEDSLSGISELASGHLQTESAPMTNENGDEEQALESHEVIELQTFSERKAWIEEKIKVNYPAIY